MLDAGQSSCQILIENHVSQSTAKTKQLLQMETENSHLGNKKPNPECCTQAKVLIMSARGFCDHGIDSNTQSTTTPCKLLMGISK